MRGLQSGRTRCGLCLRVQTAGVTEGWHLLGVHLLCPACFAELGGVNTAAEKAKVFLAGQLEKAKGAAAREKSAANKARYQARSAERLLAEERRAKQRAEVEAKVSWEEVARLREQVLELKARLSK